MTRMRKLVATVSALTPMLIAALVVSAGAGEQRGPLVQSFGGDGRITTNFAIYPSPGPPVLTDLGTDRQGRTMVAARAADRAGQPFPVFGEDPLPLIAYRLDSRGSIDRSFGGGGRLRIPHGSHAAVSPDGSVFAVGEVGYSFHEKVFLRHYTPSGRLDEAFGSRGTVRVGSHRKDFARGLIAQPQGTVEVIVTSPCGRRARCPAPGLIRYNARGRLLRSTSLPTDGGIAAISPRPDGGLIVFGPTADGEGARVTRIDARARLVRTTVLHGDTGLIGVSAVTSQRDGRIVFEEDDSIRRLSFRDKAVDSTFGEAHNGCSRTEQVLADRSGRIYAAGACGVVRLDASGHRDPSFGSGGGTFFGSGRASIIALDRIGRPIVASVTGEPFKIAVSRLTEGGAFDAGFGQEGQTALGVRGSVPSNDIAEALVRTRHGQTVAVGTSSCGRDRCFGLALSRYRSDGRADRRFGTVGRSFTPLASLDDSIVGINEGAAAATARGFIYLGGIAYDRSAQAYSFAIFRYRPSGVLDDTFGDGGASLAVPSRRSAVTDIALDERGRVLVAGQSSNCDSSRFTIARFLNDGGPDPSFGVHGVRCSIRAGRHTSPSAIRVQPDGKIVIVGGPRGVVTAVRLLSDGRPDRAFGRGGIVKLKLKVAFKPRIIDLSRSATSLALDGRGRIAIGVSGSPGGGGEVVRLLPNGSLDRSFRRRGRMFLRSFSVAEVGATRCGLVAVGTRFGGASRGPRVFAVAGIPARRSDRLRVFTPFGARVRSSGSGLVLSGRNSLVVSGTTIPFFGGGDFALAKYPFEALFPACKR